MDFLEIVKKRKSIRRFKEKEIGEEKIREILEVVRQAPSAGNLQAYKVFVVKEKEKKKKLAQAALGQDFIAEAAVVLIFCANPKESALRYGRRGQELYSIQDATIACCYAQLAATNLGLGSCWVGAFSGEEVQKVLGTDLLPVAILPIGSPNENPVRPEKKDIEEIAETL